MKKNETILRMAGLALAAIALTLAACSKGEHDAATHEGHGGSEAKGGGETATAEGSMVAYPLDFCVVSGEKLGTMGKPYVITYKGREIKFCCDGCEEDFRKDAAKFLAKIDAAAAASKGSEKKPGS